MGLSDFNETVGGLLGSISPAEAVSQLKANTSTSTLLGLGAAAVAGYAAYEQIRFYRSRQGKEKSLPGALSSRGQPAVTDQRADRRQSSRGTAWGTRGCAGPACGVTGARHWDLRALNDSPSSPSV